MNKSDIGVIGLGVMGRNLSLNFADQGFEVSVYNRTEGEEQHVVDQFLSENDSYSSISGYTKLEPFITSLDTPRKIVLMIKAGEAVDQIIGQLKPLLVSGDILIDAGNSSYRDTEKRFEDLKKEEIAFIGMGVSGGEEGARNGPSLMPGGDWSAFESIEHLLNAIAARDEEGNPCCAYIGPSGAGHFVKMVHNGIEYGEMQLLAELYSLLKTNIGNKEMADVLSEWNGGDEASFLLEITIDILKKKDGKNFLLDLVLDQSENKGSGAWSGIAALEYGTANTINTAAVFERYISFLKSERSRISAKKDESTPAAKVDVNVLRKAYSFARLINHHQGFELLESASKANQWNLNLPEIARIWTSGCIIRSRLMSKLSAILDETGSILQNVEIITQLYESEPVVTEILRVGLSNRISLPAFSSAYHYWISMSSERLPANLIQAQRDYFGGHQFRKTGIPDQYFHVNWKA